jgi:uncharacterized protein YehS (DUF1456 family)
MERKMENNDILRRLRYALNMRDSKIVEIFDLAGHPIDKSSISGILKKEEEEGYIECSDELMTSFLDGLILHKRGRREAKPGQVMKSGQEIKPNPVLTNNSVLKKLRIALELKEPDMLEILKSADIEISKNELTALFRRESHKNFKECGNQFLRNFLNGLTLRLRK